MNIQFNEIKYEYKKNTGNWEHELIGASAIVKEGQSPLEVLEALKSLVHGKEMAETPAEVVAKPEVKEDAKPAKAAKAKKTAAPETTTKVEETVKEATPVKSEEPAPKKKVIKVAATYDRANDLHKKLVGEILDLEYPDWRKDKQKAIEASKAMEGKDFMDSEGLILPSFKSAFKELMK